MLGIEAGARAELDQGDGRARILCGDADHRQQVRGARDLVRLRVAPGVERAQLIGMLRAEFAQGVRRVCSGWLLGDVGEERSELAARAVQKEVMDPGEEQRGLSLRRRRREQQRADLGIVHGREREPLVEGRGAASFVLCEPAEDDGEPVQLFAHPTGR